MPLSRGITLQEIAFMTASTELADLKTRTEALKTKLQMMYQELAAAMNTPAGKEVDLTAGEVLIAPLDDMLTVIEHTSKTLVEVIGREHYKDVFDKFEQLNQHIKTT